MHSKFPGWTRYVSCQMPTSPPLPTARLNAAPCGPVLAIGFFCIAVKILEGPPALKENRGFAEPGFSPEIAAGWVLRQFTKHAWHCHCNRKPLVDFPQAVDPHTNQKDYEVAFDLRRHSLRDYGGHSNLRLWGSVHGSISPSRP